MQKSEKSNNMEERIKLVHNYFTAHLRRELEIILEDRHLLIGYFIIVMEMTSEEVIIFHLSILKNTNSKENLDPEIQFDFQ